jgi:DNA-binding IclR family transcriptional regulator
MATEQAPRRKRADPPARAKPATTSREAAGRRVVVQSVKSAVDVLELFSVRRPAWTLTEIARELGIDQPKAFRLLSTLEAAGWLTRQSRTDPYRLSLRVWQVANAATVRGGLATTAPVFLARLTELAGETSYCGVADGREVVAVAVHVAQGRLRVATYPYPFGMTDPLHTTSLGKVLLAARPDAEVEAYIRGGLEQVTHRTSTDPAALWAEIAKIRQQGYAVNIGEALVDETGIAAPIHGDDDGIIAAICVSGPSLWDASRHAEIGEIVKQVADEATLMLRQYRHTFPQF